MYGAGDGRKEEGIALQGLKWPLLVALWYSEKSPARWCRISVTLLILSWTCSKISLTGKTLTEACARGPDGEPESVKTQSGEWSSSFLLLISHQIMLSTFKHGKVNGRLWQTMEVVSRKLEQDEKPPPVDWLNSKVITIHHSWAGTTASSCLPEMGSTIPILSLVLHAFLCPTSILILFFHRITRLTPFLKQNISWDGDV